MTEDSSRTVQLGPLAYLRFASEVAMLLGLTFGGAWAGNSFLISGLLALGLPTVTAAIWGAFVGPRGRHRLDDPARLLVEIALVGATVTLLATVGHWVFALVVAVLYLAGTGHRRASGRPRAPRRRLIRRRPASGRQGRRASG